MMFTYHTHVEKCSLLPSIVIWKPRMVSCATPVTLWSISFLLLFWTFTFYKAPNAR